MASLTVGGLDSRDSCTTVLLLTNGDTVEIDPQALFVNMVENCFDPSNPDIDRSDLESMRDFLREFGA